MYYFTTSKWLGVLVLTLTSMVAVRGQNVTNSINTNLPTDPPDPIKSRMDYIFSGLDQTAINTGILTDYGLDFSDPTRYDGVIRPENELNIDAWRMLYGTLLSSVINPSSRLVHLRTINETLETLWAGYDRSNPVVDIPVQFVAYQSLRSDALSQNLITNVNEQLDDVPGRTQSPYTTAYAFGAAPHVGYSTNGYVTFAFRSSLFVNSSNKTFSSFAVDFDNGLGYVPLAADDPISIAYGTQGTKTLKFRITFTDGSIYYSHAKFRIYAPPGNPQARYTEPESRTFRFPRSTDTACPENFANPEAWQGSFAGARVTAHYGDIGNRPAVSNTCTPQFIRPLIVIEGYDISNFSAFGEHNWDFAQFLRSNVNGGLAATVTSGSRMSDVLDVAGYDLIFVDFHDGTGDIVRNAYLLENVIQWVNAHKIINPQNGTRERNVVLGQSMGGLVARYAVCDLEKRRIANTSVPGHEVRTLITQDSPHRGANVPLGFQALINNLSGQSLTRLGLFSYGVVGAIVGSFLTMDDLIPALKQGKQLLNAPATRQMLLVQDGLTNSFLNGQYRDMVTFPAGYSTTFTTRATANGSECGNNQIIAAGSELLYANASLYVNQLLFFAATDIAAGTVGIVHPGLGALTRVGLYALAPFTGKYWKTTFDVRATAANGTGQVLAANIRFEKRVLFLIPINITIHNSTRSTSGLTPWDSSPGGYYNMRTFMASIPANPNINLYPIVVANLTIRMAPLFNFVPTVSALDITPVTIPAAAITAPYTGGNNTQYPSWFANYKTQERNTDDALGSAANWRHLQLSQTGAEWLVNVIQGNNPISNCSFACPNLTGAASIAGESALCQDPRIYTLAGLPAGATASWTVTGPFQRTSASTGTSATIQPTANSGNGTLTAHITTPACTRAHLTKPLNVQSRDWPAARFDMWGYPEYFYPESTYTFYTNQQYRIDVIDYPWKAAGEQIYISVHGQSEDVDFRGPGYILKTFSVMGPHTLVANVMGVCGAIGVTTNIYVEDRWGRTSIANSDFSYYPNPANEELQVSLNSIEKDTPETNRVVRTIPAAFGIRLLDPMGNTVATASGNGIETVTLATDNLPEGVYYLTVTNGKKVYTEPVVIHH